MTSMRQGNSSRRCCFACFLLLACFSLDGIPSTRLGMEAFRPPWRFSAWVWWVCRSTQLREKAGHGSANLCQSQDRAARFPSSIHALNQGSSQDQLVMGTGDNLCPPQRLGRGAQTWFVPHQHLFVQSEAMLVRIPQAIDRADLGQRWGFAFKAHPDKPTDFGIAWSGTGSMTDHLDHADLNPARLAQVQTIPTAHFHAFACGIGAFPSGIRLSVSRGIIALEPGSIFAARSPLPRLACRRRMVKDPVGFDPQQATGGQIAHARKARSAGVPSISQDHRAQTSLCQQLDHRLQLPGCYLRRQIQDKGSLSWLSGQQHHAADQPTWTHHMSLFRRIGDWHQRSVLRRLCLRAIQIAGINADEDVLTATLKLREVHKHFAQPIFVDQAVFKGFLQTGPFSLEQRRERQFGETVGSGFSAQRIDRVEQSITSSLETTIHPVTKLLQCVKVHPSNAPFGCDTWNITRFGNPPQGGVAFFVQLV